MRWCSVALAALALTAATADAQDETSGAESREAFEDRLVIGTATAGDVTTKYALYVPPDYNSAESWPLILFLHGAGERGEDGLGQTRVGIGPAIRANPERFPCLVLMPQCPTGRFWPAEPSEITVKDAVSQLPRRLDSAASAGLIRDALEQVKSQYNVDPDRIALTGLSMGGFGAFKFGADHIDEFSCVLAICGGGSPTLAPALARRPLRVFHGANDPVVSPRRSIQLVEAIEAAGGDVAYTEYEGVFHDAWVRAYANPDNIAWLLNQKRP